MTRIKRQSLKDRFRVGRMPTEGDFGDLIDSMVNLLDEGFDKTADDGLKVNQIGSGRLLSFYENLSVNSPQWFLELGQRNQGERSLHFGAMVDDKPGSVLSLVQRNPLAGDPLAGSGVAVGINRRDPRFTLDVEGTVCSSGRQGKPGEMEVLADGNWHDVTGDLVGCNAFEVVAGVGCKDDSDGKYALTHAVALNTFNGRGSVRYQQAWFGSSCSRIEVRWSRPTKGSPFTYRLQLRVRCPYMELEKDGSCRDDKCVWVRYHIAQMWFDTLMEQSTEPPRKANR